MSTQTVSQPTPVVQVADERKAATLDSAVGAALIAGGVGSFVLGLAVVGAEANAGIKSFLTWISSVGPLSGKVGVSVIAFVLSWIILHFVLRDHTLKLTTSFVIAVILLGLGLLLTFPPVFVLFAP
jgi:hypothetical protein